MYPVGLCSRPPWGVVDDLCFRNSVENAIEDHEVSDSFADIKYLYLDVLVVNVSGPSTNGYGCLQFDPG